MYPDRRIEMDKMSLYGKRMERIHLTNTGKSRTLTLIPSKMELFLIFHSEFSQR